MRSNAERLRERLKTLTRRADHLAKRIAESPLDLTYDKAELAALRWAIQELEEKVPLKGRGEKRDG